MLFIGKKRGEKYGIIDTDNGICEYLTVAELKKYRDMGTKIEGVYADHIEVIRPEFFGAKAKLLNIKVSPFVFEKDKDYLIMPSNTGHYVIVAKDEYAKYMENKKRADETGNVMYMVGVEYLSIKELVKYNSHLRILNFINNDYYNCSFCEEIHCNDYILGDSEVYDFEDFYTECISEMLGRVGTGDITINRVSTTQLLVRSKTSYYCHDFEYTIIRTKLAPESYVNRVAFIDGYHIEEEEYNELYDPSTVIYDY